MIPLWRLKITHIPTGIFVTLTSNNFKSEYKAKKEGVKLLKSKIYMYRKEHLKKGKLAAYYNLPDDIVAPNDLYNYKQDA